MKLLIEMLLLLAAAACLVPVVVLTIEILLAPAVGKMAISAGNAASVPFVVIVPAHNEELTLAPTLQDIRPQLGALGRLVVVADNCSDDTAAVAERAGAEVVSRNDPDKRGKGYALDAAVQFVERSGPPQVAVIVDADCRVGSDSIAQLVETCVKTGRPVQCLDLMKSPPGTSHHRISEFAWLVKNQVRASGLATMGLPCQLMGTGMAFPWQALAAADLAHGSIVEDLKLGFDLALQGRPPVFLPSASVTSQFPNSQAAADAQRRRWEHGHIALIRELAMPALLQAVRRRDFALAAMSLDLAVPPLALLALILSCVGFVTGVAALLDYSAVPFLITLIASALFASAVTSAWVRFGRDVISLADLGLVVRYVCRKARHYPGALLGRRGMAWERAERDRTQARGTMHSAEKLKSTERSAAREIPVADNAEGRWLK